MKRVGIIQSNYIPWRGYFDFIRSVDAFVLLDDVQYTRRDWRNRNVIKTASGPRWLTIPVETKGRYDQRIDQIEIADASWIDDHLRSLQHAYARAGAFASIFPRLSDCYRRLRGVRLLTAVNEELVREVCMMLEIETPLYRSSEFTSRAGKNERLIDICTALNATHYLSGPAAQSYMDPALWQAAGIEVEYKSYEGYREYPQLHGEFTAAVSVVDLLLNVGASAKEYL